MNGGWWFWDSEPHCRTIFLLAGLSFSFIAFCIHTLIHEVDFKVKTTSKTKMASRCQYFLLKCFIPPPPGQGPGELFSNQFFQNMIFMKYQFSSIPLFYEGGYLVTCIKVKHTNGWRIWHVILEKSHLYLIYTAICERFLKVSAFSYF